MSLYKYEKGDFTNSTVVFYQKSILDFLNRFTNKSGYLNFMKCKMKTNLNKIVL